LAGAPAFHFSQQAIARTPSKGSLKTTPSAKGLEDAAAAAAKSPYMAKVNTLLSSSSSSNSASSLGSLSARPPSAARLAPLPADSVGSITSTASASAAPPVSSAVQAVMAARSSVADEEAMRSISREELIRITMALNKEKNALKQHLVELNSGSGMDISAGGVTSALQHPSAPTTHSPRSSKVVFNTAANTIHRSASLVVEFAEPRHQQRPSMIAHNLEQIRWGCVAGFRAQGGSIGSVQVLQRAQCCQHQPSPTRVRLPAGLAWLPLCHLSLASL
jgi:hypothetical protein